MGCVQVDCLVRAELWSLIFVIILNTYAILLTKHLGLFVKMPFQKSEI